MRLIRKGNDIGVVWSIFANQGGSVVEYSLQDRNISLFLETGKNKYEIKDFTIVGEHYNSVKFTFWGKDQIACGSYFLTMVENKGEEDMRVLDFKDAFAIVRHSWETGGSDNPHITTEVVELSTNIGDIIDERLIPDTIARRTDFADYLPLDGSSTMTGSLDMGDNKITNVANPTSDYDATNKKYVDDGIAALDGTITLSNPSSTVTQSATQNAGTIIPVVSSFTLKERDGKLIEKGSGTTDSKVGTTYVDAGGSALKALNDAKSYADTKDAEINAKISTDASSSNKVMDKAYIDGKDAAINAKIPSAASSSNQLADKAWVNALIAAIDQFHYEIYSSLSSITDPQGNVLYLIGPKSGTSGDMYEEYVYSNGWVKIGDTSIDLSGYMPKSGGTFTGDVNIDEGDLYVKGRISVDGGEILMTDDPTSDWAAINKGYVDNALSTKYTKPSDGIPKADLAIDVQNSLQKKYTVETIDADQYLVITRSESYGVYDTIMVIINIYDTVDTILITGLTSNGNLHAVIVGPNYGIYPNIVENDYGVAIQVKDVCSGAQVIDFVGDVVDSVYVEDSFNIHEEYPIEEYQDKLISGTNIKTINNTSLLGSGNIPVATPNDLRTKCISAGSGGDSLFILLAGESDKYYNGFRIDMAGKEGDSEEALTGSLLVTVHYDENTLAHWHTKAYYYGVEISRLIDNVAIYEDDGNYYLAVTFANMTYRPINCVVTSLSNDEPSLSSVEIYEQTLIGTITPTVIELTANKKSSWSTTPNNTNYPTEKLVKDTIDALPVIPSGGTTGQVLAKASGTNYDVEWANGGGSSDVFVAEYGVTTLQEISDAVSNGKAVLCNKNGATFSLVSLTSLYCRFNALNNSTSYYFVVNSPQTWSKLTSKGLEETANKVSTISGNETSTTKYPNTKAVADALGKMGVISQTQTWRGTGSNPSTYVMSNPVTGLIPQANIDLFEAAGATFNETTGYFEFNGLTDISYEEMQAIFNYSFGFSIFRADAQYTFYSYDGLYGRPSIRTIIAPPGVRTAGTGMSLSWAMYNTVIEAVDLHLLPVSNLSQTFRVCPKIRSIKGLNISGITAPGSVSNCFLSCPSLETLELYGSKVSIDISSASVLSKDCLLYMINNEASTSAITITLHASVYAKCQIGGEWYSDINTALSAHTNVSLQSA